ncbi:YqgQ family protein, partial [Vagococcus teuberi]
EAGLIDKQEYIKAMLVLKREHHLEEDYQEGQ